MRILANIRGIDSSNDGNCFKVINRAPCHWNLTIMRGNYESAGPLTSLFPDPVAKVLDQSLIVGNMEQTTSMLAESTGLTFKTVKKVVEKLVERGFMAPTRKIGNAQAYKFNVENDLHELIEWATKYQFSRDLS